MTLNKTSLQLRIALAYYYLTNGQQLDVAAARKGAAKLSNIITENRFPSFFQHMRHVEFEKLYPDPNMMVVVPPLENFKTLEERILETAKKRGCSMPVDEFKVAKVLRCEEIKSYIGGDPYTLVPSEVVVLLTSKAYIKKWERDELRLRLVLLKKRTPSSSMQQEGQQSPPLSENSNHLRDFSVKRARPENESDEIGDSDIEYGSLAG